MPRHSAPLHATLRHASEHGIAGELGSIVVEDHARLAALSDQPGQLAHHMVPLHRGVRHRCQALPGHAGSTIRNSNSRISPNRGSQALP